MQQDKAVTRSEIMDSLVQEVGLTRQDSGELLERVLELISEELTEGRTVKLARFGNFVVREKLLAWAAIQKLVWKQRFLLAGLLLFVLLHF